jgi:glycosyltransferase involved in cell wall biosynthesis
MTAAARAVLRPVARGLRTGSAWLRGAAGHVAGRPSGVRVSYGHPRLPGPDEPAVGGIVKLQCLAREYPNTLFRYNVLYLVSSRLPDGAVSLAAWARRKGARVVVNQNGVAYPGWYGPGWEAINAPMRELLAMADHVFYQSEFCRLSADRFVGPPGGSWEVLHNAVDTTVFAPGAARPAGAPLTLLLAGSQDTWYRLAVAVETLARLRAGGRDARLLVTGRLGWTKDAAEARHQAEALVAERGVGGLVEFTGPYSQRQAPGLFTRGDILIHTKYNDPCPAVVVEALASGLPVAFSATGGVPELVGDAGVGVPSPLDWEQDQPPDPVALARAVDEIAGALPEYAARARRRAVEHLNLDAWMARHRAVFGAP